MSIARKFLIGCSMLALVTGGAAASGKAKVKVPANCAMPADVAAMQVSAIQQELMDAALTCGDQARSDFNAFQTTYGVVLRKSDKQLLTLFRRVQGKKGDAAYNLFKTDLAARAEFRRIQHSPNFCAAANKKVMAALDPAMPSLQDFAATAAVVDFVWPVSACAVVEASSGDIPNVVPLPNPLRVAELALPSAPAVVAPAGETSPAAPSSSPAAVAPVDAAISPAGAVVAPAAAPADGAATATVPAVPQAPEPAQDKPKEKSSGWFGW